MKNITSSIVGSLVLLTSFSAHAERKWNDANNPNNFDSNYKYNFNLLPSQGSIIDSNKGWSDSYWPLTRGSIADRWQVPEYAYRFKDLARPAPNQIMNMSQAEINLLSPAEKFDIIRGKLDLPLMKYLQEKLNPTPKDWWHGICNGWTQASLNYDEPQPIIYKSPISGVTVPLGSSDIKGLLSYYYANFDDSGYSKEEAKGMKNIGYIGKSCRGIKKFLFDFDGSCGDNDVNAGAFHIVITNELGLRHKAFAMDRDPSPQVWNHPVVGYEMKVLNVNTSDLSKKATKGTVKEVTVETTVKLVNELYNTEDKDLEDDHHSAPQYQALGKGKQHYLTLVYKYILELDSRDQVIGGEWTDDNETHPDLLWKQPFVVGGLAVDTKDSNEDWSILADIMRKATAYVKAGLPAAPEPAQATEQLNKGETL